MKKPRLLLLAPLALGGAALAGICWGVLLSSIWWYRPPPPVGVVLIYEVDAERTPNPNSVNMNHLVAAIDERLNPGRHQGARVRQLEDGRIEIGVFGNDPEAVRRIERMVERTGTLEFRIVANSRDHQALIEQALGESDNVLKDAEGTVEARWAPIQSGQEESFQDYLYHDDGEGHKVTIPESEREVAIRETRRDGQTTLEVLLVEDILDVTGAYLTEARTGWDETGEPCVRFELDRNGARLFRRLTSKNLPDEAQDFYRKLGIILDGKLYSAPRLTSTIYDQGVIEGSFTQEEVNDLVTVLNAGSLPVAIRQVEKRTVGGEQ